MTIQNIIDAVDVEHWDEEIVFTDGSKFFLCHKQDMSVENGILEIVLSEDKDLEDLNLN